MSGRKTLTGKASQGLTTLGALSRRAMLWPRQEHQARLASRSGATLLAQEEPTRCKVAGQAKQSTCQPPRASPMTKAAWGRVTL